MWNGKSWKENQERKIGHRKNQAYQILEFFISTQAANYTQKITVLKLRENYLQEIEHLKTNNKQGHESLDICLKDLGERVDLHTNLIEDHRLCRTSIAKISETVEGLTDALKSQNLRQFDTR